MRLLLRLTVLIVLASLLLAGGMVVFAPHALDVATANRSTGNDLELRGLAQRSLVYDSQGNVLATLHGEENRSPVPLEDVPDEVVDTIVAIEDQNFYDHGGLDLGATFRALFENVSAGEIEQGGSTITMQVVKNLILSPEQDISRKVKEISLAVQLEREMSKDEILETYLNTVYFGHGAYGVKAAAEIYWQMDVEDLSWPEAAMLAALVRNPVGYDPVLFPDLALERRKIVLDRLAELDLITEEQADEYHGAPLPTDPKPVLPPPEDYFVEEVKEQLLRDPRLGATYQERENAVFRGGLRIYTTLDPVAQEMAEQARAEVIGPFWPPYTAAMVGIEPASGAVRVMVGGPGFESHKYNIATHYPGRQTGSSFKTFVLLAALENGYVPADRLAGGGDFPNPGGTPDPYRMPGSGGTITSITTASSNGAYVRLGQIVGLDRVVEVARRAGITVPLDPSIISMPLGTFEVPPIEMVSGYSAIAYGGLRMRPYLVQRVEDSFGEVIFEHRPDPRRVVSRQTACLATQILNANTTGGTGTRARIPSQPVAGKTGTTDDKKDAWFVGFSPYLVTGVWMGDPDTQPDPMSNVGGIAVFGGTYPAQIFGNFMARYHEGKPVVEFPECEPTRPGQFIKMGNETEPFDSSVFEQLLPPEEQAPPEEGDEPKPPPTTVPPTTVPPTTVPPTTVPPPTTTTPSNE